MMFVRGLNSRSYVFEAMTMSQYTMFSSFLTL
jgi:hypothetical protein